MLAFLALVTAMMMQSASDIMMATVSSIPLAQMELNAAAAGFVMLCTVNFVIIILVGSDLGNGYLGTYGSTAPRVAPIKVTKAPDNGTPAQTPRSDDSGHEAVMVPADSDSD